MRKTSAKRAESYNTMVGSLFPKELNETEHDEAESGSEEKQTPASAMKTLTVVRTKELTISFQYFV